MDTDQVFENLIQAGNLRYDGSVDETEQEEEGLRMIPQEMTGGRVSDTTELVGASQGSVLRLLQVLLVWHRTAIKGESQCPGEIYLLLLAIVTS